MADFVFNIAKGRAAYLAELPAANDSLVAVPIAAASIETDTAMKDHDTLAAVVGGSTEQTTMGRKTLSNVTVTVNDTNDRVEVDADDITWTSPTGDAISKVVIAYKPDTSSADSAIVPLVALDLSFTPGSGDLLMQFAPGGFYQAS